MSKRIYLNQRFKKQSKRTRSEKEEPWRLKTNDQDLYDLLNVGTDADYAAIRESGRKAKLARESNSAPQPRSPMMGFEDDCDFDYGHYFDDDDEFVAAHRAAKAAKKFKTFNKLWEDIFKNHIITKHDHLDDFLDVCQRANNQIEQGLTYLRGNTLDNNTRSQIELSLMGASSILSAFQQKHLPTSSETSPLLLPSPSPSALPSLLPSELNQELQLQSSTEGDQ